MQTHISKIVLASIALAISGCATPDLTTREGAQIVDHQDVETLPESVITEPESFTGVIVYGDRGYTGLVGDIYYPSIQVNGAPVGKCEKRMAMMIPLEPGTHIVSAHSENTVEHTIDVEEGSVFYFRCNFRRIGGIIYPPAVLAPATAEEAFEVVNGN